MVFPGPCHNRERDLGDVWFLIWSGIGAHGLQGLGGLDEGRGYPRGRLHVLLPNPRRTVWRLASAITAKRIRGDTPTILGLGGGPMGSFAPNELATLRWSRRVRSVKCAAYDAQGAHKEWSVPKPSMGV